MRPTIRVFLILISVIWVTGEGAGYAVEKAPSFTLTEWGTEKQVSINDFRGKIVVLDFFNVSCPKCIRASWEVQIEIQEFYNVRSGNPHGIEVQVVAVNSEVAELEDMNAFKEETELGFVLDDSKGTLLERYGGTTVPYLVVIDATGNEPEITTSRIVYQSGYEGSKKLREIIDAITGQVEPSESASSSQSSEVDRKITHETVFDTAALIASDVFVTDTLAAYHYTRPSMEFDLSISYRRIDMDYASEYLAVSRERDLSADSIGFQISTKFNLNKTLTLMIDGGVYDGYQTYRALWLNEFYRHMFDVLSEYIVGLEGYKEANPWGYNVSSRLRWEYLPYSGFVEADISFQRDIVSPGYETGIPFVRLRDTYNTLSGHVAFENVLTRHLRTLVECRIDDISERDARYTLHGSLNYALGEHWVTRLDVAGSKEDPHFKSKSISTVLERDWHSTWFVSLFGRYYDDTSEIANAIGSNAAAPPLETFQTGMGLRWQGLRSSIKLVLGPCFSRYEREPERDMAFDQLYKDRNWFSVQFAFLHHF